VGTAFVVQTIISISSAQQKIVGITTAAALLVAPRCHGFADCSPTFKLVCGEEVEEFVTAMKEIYRQTEN
jgi:hypothetical protein